jgi:hypothetical protein
MLSPVACFPGEPSSVPAGQYFGTATFNLHPYFRGHIHISGPAISDEGSMDAGFWADPNELDLKKHVWMYKKQRESMKPSPATPTSSIPLHQLSQYLIDVKLSN